MQSRAYQPVVGHHQGGRLAAWLENGIGHTTKEGGRKRWQRYCQANGIQKISPYEMRHTFVSIAKNLPEGQLKALVGHSRSMDTYGTYSHQMQGDQQETALRLEEIFSNFLPHGKSKP